MNGFATESFTKQQQEESDMTTITEIQEQIGELERQLEDYSEFQCCMSQACDCYEYMVTDKKYLVSQLQQLTKGK